MTVYLQRAIDRFNANPDEVPPLSESASWPSTRQGHLDAREEIDAAQRRAANFRIYDWFGAVTGISGLSRDQVTGRILSLFGNDLNAFLSWLVEASSAGAPSSWMIPRFNVADGQYNLQQEYPDSAPFYQPGVRPLPFLCVLPPRRASPAPLPQGLLYGRLGLGIVRLPDPVEVELIIERARREAITALRCARDQLRRGSQRATDLALCWFGDYLRTPGDFTLDTLLRLIEDALAAADVADIEYFPASRCGTTGTSFFHRYACLALSAGFAARAFPAGTGDFGRGNQIAVFDIWLREPALRTTRLIHELFHLNTRLPTGHEFDDPFNAFRLQGFVSRLCFVPFDEATVSGHAPGSSGC